MTMAVSFIFLIVSHITIEELLLPRDPSLRKNASLFSILLFWHSENYEIAQMIRKGAF